MNSCPQCGAAQATATPFCPSCGTALSTTGEVPTQATPTQGATTQPSDTTDAPTTAIPTATAPSSSTPDAGEAPLSAPRAGADGSAASGTALQLDPRALAAPAIGGLVAYVAALVTAAVSLVVMAIGASLAGDGSSSDFSSTEDVDTFSLITSLPVQTVGLALFGTLRLTYESRNLGNFSMTPLLVTAAAVLGAAWWARRSRGATTGIGQVAVQAAVAGLVLTLANLLMVTLFALEAHEMGESVRIDASSVGGFFGGWVLGALGWLAGSLLARRHVSPAQGPWTGALGTFGVHLGAWSLALLVFGLVGSIVKGEFGEFLAMFPAWPHLALWGWSIVHFGDVHAAGESAGLWSGVDAWVKVLWVLLVPLLIVAAGVHWWVRRDRRHAVLRSPLGWAALPLVFLVGALLMMLLTRVSGSYSGFGFLGADAAAVTLLPTILVIAPLVGLLVELASRYAAPHLVGVLPPHLVERWGRDSGSAASVAGTGNTSVAPAGAGIGGAHAADLSDGTASPATPLTDDDAAPLGAGADGQPMDPRTKRVLMIIGALVLGLVLLTALLGVAGRALGSAFFGPEKQVEEYFDAVVAGEGTRAMEISAPNIPTDQRLFMVDEVYSETEKRPSSYEIGEVQAEGDSGTVEVTYTQDGVEDTVEVPVKKDGKAWLFFERWSMQQGGPLTERISKHVEMETDTLVVNGREVPASAFGQEGLAVLPGQYEVSLPESKYFTSSTSTEVAGPAGEQSMDGADPITQKPTKALEDEAVKQARAELDECLKSDSPEPEGCDFSAFVWGEDIRNGSWKMTQEPTWELQEMFGGFRLVTTEPGTATFSYEEDTAYADDEEEWEKAEEEAPVTLERNVSVDGDKVTLSDQ